MKQKSLLIDWLGDMALAGLAIASENGFPMLGNSFPIHREIHIFEGFMQQNGSAMYLPHAQMNHFSYTKGSGWKIHPAIKVSNE